MVVIEQAEGFIMADTTVVWGKKVSAGLKNRAMPMTATLRTKPDYVMATTGFGTGGTFDPAQANLANPKGGPVGLIQFTDVVAAALSTTNDELVMLTAAKPLDYCVEKHLMKKRDLGLRKAQDRYLAVHWSVATSKPLSQILYSKTGVKQSRMFHRANAKLALDKSDQVTLEEAARKVEGGRSPRRRREVPVL